MPGFDISYEHFIDPVSSWGVTGFVNLDSNLSEGVRFDRFEFSPYYRLYFSQREQNNSGFFVQPFISWLSTEYNSYTNSTDSFVSKDFLGFAGGALIGFKWINQKNTVLKFMVVLDATSCQQTKRVLRKILPIPASTFPLVNASKFFAASILD